MPKCKILYSNSTYTHTHQASRRTLYCIRLFMDELKCVVHIVAKRCIATRTNSVHCAFRINSVLRCTLHYIVLYSSSIFYVKVVRSFLVIASHSQLFETHVRCSVRLILIIVYSSNTHLHKKNCKRIAVKVCIVHSHRHTYVQQ